MLGVKLDVEEVNVLEVKDEFFVLFVEEFI